MSRIGELLVREKMLSLQQLQQAQEEAKRTGKRLGATLSRLGYVKDQELTQFVAKQYSLPSINLTEIEIDASVLKLVPREICEKHQVIPVRRYGPDADRRDGRPVEHLRDRRAQVPHPVQHRAGRRVGERARGRAVALLRQGPRPRPDDGRVRRRQRRLRLGHRRTSRSTSSTSRTRPARRRSSSCATRSCCRRSRRRPRTSTSSPTRRASGSGSGSTASSRRRCGRRSSSATRSRRASRSWRRSTSPSAACRRTAASSSRSAPTSEMDFRVSVLPTLFGEKIVMRLLDKSNAAARHDEARLRRAAARGLQGTRSRSPTAWCWSPARPARARPPRCTRRCPSSTPSIATSPPPRIRSSSTCTASTRCRCTRTSASTSRPRCARSCARTRTSSWSARSATSRPPRSASRPRSPATSCCRRCTPTTRRRRCRACSTWASSRSS